MKKITFTDFLIIIILSIFSVSGIFYGLKREKGKLVLINTPEGEFIYPLNVDRIIKLKGKLGEYVIEIRNQKVFVIETHCPKKICTHFKISKVNDSIVCPPNMINVRIIGEEKESVDGITE